MQGGSPAGDDQTGIALVPRRRTLASARAKGKGGRHVEEMQNACCRERWLSVEFEFAEGYNQGRQK